MKYALIALGIIVAGAVGWYLISPAFISIEADEALPFATEGMENAQENTDGAEEQAADTDAMAEMDAQTRAEFEAEMDAAKDDTKETDDPMPVPEPRVTHQGTFQPEAHEVEGEAKVVAFEGERILRFEDFETINGPNLHIYLAADLEGEDYVDLGEIRATKGNVNYEIPEDVDLSKYKYVMVWCVPFEVLFSYAELQ